MRILSAITLDIKYQKDTEIYQRKKLTEAQSFLLVTVFLVSFFITMFTPFALVRKKAKESRNPTKWEK